MVIRSYYEDYHFFQMFDDYFDFDIGIMFIRESAHQHK